MKIENKIALVTGANRGIGKALVESLLQHGAEKVYAAARKLDSLPDFGDDRVVPVQLDINNLDEIVRVAAQITDVDLLLNNAGVAAFVSLIDGPIDLIARDMQTNYFGTLNVIRAFIPSLEKRPGSAIANIASIAAFVNFPMLGGYSASKAANFSMSQGLRIELAPRGISVHTINPGPIDTDMAKGLEMDKTTPAQAAANMLAGIEAGEADIFPDEGAQGMISVWKNDYRELEAMVAQMAEG